LQVIGAPFEVVDASKERIESIKIGLFRKNPYLFDASKERIESIFSLRRKVEIPPQMHLKRELKALEHLGMDS